MRVQIVTNSQGSSVGVAPGQNYPALVARTLGPQYDVRSLVVSGWALPDFLGNLEDNVIVHKPDLVIFQVGIVEAAQRILSNREKAFMSLLPFGRLLTAAMHRHRDTVLTWRKRLGIATRAVAPDEFLALLERLSQRLTAADIRFFFIPMPIFPDAGKSMRHPFVNEDIALYNGMLARFGCLDASSAAQPSFFQTGTVHFTAEGHAWVADAVVREIRQRSAVAA